MWPEPRPPSRNLTFLMVRNTVRSFGGIKLTMLENYSKRMNESMNSLNDPDLYATCKELPILAIWFFISGFREVLRVFFWRSIHAFINLSQSRLYDSYLASNFRSRAVPQHVLRTLYSKTIPNMNIWTPKGKVRSLQDLQFFLFVSYFWPMH